MNGDVRVTLLRRPDGKFVWSAVHVDHNGDLELIGICPDHDAAKSGGWAYAQAHGAVFVPTRRGRP